MASASIDGGSLVFAAACLVVLTLGIGSVPLLLVRAPSIDTLLRRSAAGAGGSTRAARVGGALVTVEVMGTVALLVIAYAPRRELRQPARRERGLRPRGRPDGSREPESRALPPTRRRGAGSSGT